MDIYIKILLDNIYINFEIFYVIEIGVSFWIVFYLIYEIKVLSKLNKYYIYF